ncbi:MAG TPA: DUF4389 domain-containing protein [Acidimicrobiia bacterium]|nr:DUF4389 domain-containing protein [Acidimicrobiia bacterium]
MAYPVDLHLETPDRIANWRPLVHWLLAIPHLLLANALSNVGPVVAVISWFAIVFTGRLPEGLARFQCLVIRYQARAYSYALWMREPYPAFDFSMAFDDPGGDPLRVDLRPQLTDRNRLTVGLRLLWIIPIALFFALVALVAAVIVFLGFFAVLFTGRWPAGMFRFLVGTARLSVRVGAYGSLLVDDYPPFSLDSEPSTAPA